ncbi:MAG TPA: hypothetical protein VN851_23210 [Thermoanaerobaculia bacterium]|nr:hypothetical protein [Thermoanaerobaculia bacterium]
MSDSILELLLQLRRSLEGDDLAPPRSRRASHRVQTLPRSSGGSYGPLSLDVPSPLGPPRPNPKADLAEQLADELSIAEVTLRTVAPLSQEFRRLLRSPQLVTWGLFARLLLASREKVATAPVRSLRLARAALEVARKLDPDRYGARRVDDWVAAGLAARADAERAGGHLAAAEESRSSAHRARLCGSGDASVASELFRVEAEILAAKGAFEEAEQKLARAERLARFAGESEREVALLARRGELHAPGDPMVACARLREALDRLASVDEHRRPRFELAVGHRLAQVYLDLDQPGAAESLMTRLNPLYRRFGRDRALSDHREWLEARLHRAHGNLFEATDDFQMISILLASEGRAFDSLLVALDYWAALVAQKETSDALEDLDRLAEDLQATGALHNEGLVTLTLLRHEIAAGRADRATFKKTALYFHRAWRRPLRTARKEFKPRPLPRPALAVVVPPSFAGCTLSRNISLAQATAISNRWAAAGQ